MDQEKVGKVFAEVSQVLANENVDGYEMMAVGQMLVSSSYIHIAFEKDQGQDDTDRSWLDWASGGTPE